jgi:hypothetical protein
VSLHEVVLPSVQGKQAPGKAGAARPSRMNSAATESSYVRATFELHRKSDYYVLYVLYPMIFFVVIAWASFFIVRSAAPARGAPPWVPSVLSAEFVVVQLCGSGQPQPRLRQDGHESALELEAAVRIGARLRVNCSTHFNASYSWSYYT